jgi:hypothetical protein
MKYDGSPLLEYALVINASQLPGDADPVASELDMLATVKGSDPFTFNAILGIWHRAARCLELGISGQLIPSEIRTSSS